MQTLSPPHLSKLQVLNLRALLRETLRSFFQRRAYIEVETPSLVVTPGSEVHLGYFSSSWVDHHHRPHSLWLRSSPELHMKQMLSWDGVERVFQLATCFRNDGELSDWHNPEFTMLEWYRAHIDADSFIQETFELIAFTNEVFQKQGLGMALPRTPQKISVYEAFKNFAGITLEDQDALLWRKASRAGVLSVCENEDFETSFFKVLLEKVEPRLRELSLCVLYDYPPSQAALARVVSGRAKRFEFYVNGHELSNGFWELTDPETNERRFQETRRRRLQLGKPAPEDDPSFFAALRSGIPDSCGNALGVDRLLALLCQQTSIHAILPFSFASAQN